MSYVSKWAQQAIDHTKRELGEIPSNVLNDGGRETSILVRQRQRYQSMEDEHMLLQIRLWAKLAKEKDVGNCGEYAAVAFEFLRTNIVRLRLEYAVYAHPGDHAFVLLNRDYNSDLNKETTWGANCLVVDAWAGEVVPAHQYRSNMPPYPDRVYPPETWLSLHTLPDKTCPVDATALA